MVVATCIRRHHLTRSVHDTSFESWDSADVGVAINNPRARRVVAPSHLLGQQCAPCVGTAGMHGTIMRDVGAGGTTSMRWLHRLGRAMVVA